MLVERLRLAAFRLDVDPDVVGLELLVLLGQT